jgi:hypothetical protein
MKKTFKVIPERSHIRFVNAKSEFHLRIKMYQLLGSELFQIKKL